MGGTTSATDIVQQYVFTPEVLWIAFGIVVIIVAILSAILVYHWRQYGMGKRIFYQVEWLYLAGAIVLTVVALIALILYSL